MNSRNLSGTGRLELLTFGLEKGQKYGINVFKVKEILKCPKIYRMPNSHSYIKGMITVRENTLAVIDLNKALGGISTEDLEEKYAIVAEYNNEILAFLVYFVDNIVSYEWSQVKEPPSGLGNNYLTSIAHKDDVIIQILDVEKIISEISKPKNKIDEIFINNAPILKSNQYVMVVDDSKVATNQITQSLKAMNINFKTFENGKLALEYLENNDTDLILKDVALIISDIEMPEMDGYSLTKKIKNNPSLNSINIILHTSITGVFNKDLVKNVGADDFICKFDPNILAESIIKNIKAA